jgi:hypothetical protein
MVAGGKGEWRDFSWLLAVKANGVIFHGCWR